MIKQLKHLLFGSKIVIFHEFHKPPYGGGNQFLIALKSKLEQLGYDVGANTVGSHTKSILFNSFNFDFDKLRKLKNPNIRMIHRVDGPIGVYRGKDEKVDYEICKINNELADATIFQSQYSLNKHIELGLHFKNPTVIYNAADPRIFHANNRITFEPQKRKIKLLAAAWSDNPKKGLAVYKWLDQNLDFSKYDFTFVGRIKEQFQNINHITALPSNELAEIYRSHDIYLTASQDDPCSNALIEALSCGLPAIFLISGGHPELVKNAGLGFKVPEEIPNLLKKIEANYSQFQYSKNGNQILPIFSLDKTANEYLKLL